MLKQLIEKLYTNKETIAREELEERIAEQCARGHSHISLRKLPIPETGSTVSEIKVDTCANCHPFYTGKTRHVQADGRVARFNRKYGLNNK